VLTTTLITGKSDGFTTMIAVPTKRYFRNARPFYRARFLAVDYFIHFLPK
jgi:hypothetical protein